MSLPIFKLVKIFLEMGECFCTYSIKKLLKKIISRTSKISKTVTFDVIDVKIYLTTFLAIKINKIIYLNIKISKLLSLACKNYHLCIN